MFDSKMQEFLNDKHTQDQHNIHNTQYHTEACCELYLKPMQAIHQTTQAEENSSQRVPSGLSVLHRNEVCVHVHVLVAYELPKAAKGYRGTDVEHTLPTKSICISAILITG